MNSHYRKFISQYILILFLLLYSSNKHFFSAHLVSDSVLGGDNKEREKDLNMGGVSFCLL